MHAPLIIFSSLYISYRRKAIYTVNSNIFLKKIFKMEDNAPGRIDNNTALGRHKSGTGQMEESTIKNKRQEGLLR
jgi:hypothetical protein